MGVAGSAASKTLMPVNFAILSGGTLTSIGTSTNILVLSIGNDLGLPQMRIFRFTPIAAAAPQYQARLIVEASGKLVDRTTLERFHADSESSVDQHFVEVVVGAEAGLVGRTLSEVRFADQFGVMGMLATRCVLFAGSGRALSLEVVLLVASSVALGQSLGSTGAADWIASGVAFAIQHLPAAGQLAAFITFSAVLTNFVSNSAAAAIGTPITMSMARHYSL